MQMDRVNKAQPEAFDAAPEAADYLDRATRYGARMPLVRLWLGEIALRHAFAGGHQAVVNCTFEVEGSSKPSCVAEIVFRYYD